MNTLSALEQRVEQIEARNKKVELDKSWEGSITRRLSIMVLTYLVIFLYLAMIGVASPYLNAIVPTVGFLLSSLTLSLLKKIWSQYQR